MSVQEFREEPSERRRTASIGSASLFSSELN